MKKIRIYKITWMEKKRYYFIRKNNVNARVLYYDRVYWSVKRKKKKKNTLTLLKRSLCTDKQLSFNPS